MDWKNHRSRVAEAAGRQIVYLLREVENYLSKTSVSAARFGRDVMGDPRFVFDLRNGREPRPRTVRRVRNFLESGR